MLQKIVLLLIFLCLIGIASFFGYYIGQRSSPFGGLAYFDLLQKRTKWQTNCFNFIAHAGGEINGKVYTNSKEALLNAIQNGYHLVEIDLIETSDGHLVGAHDWVHFKTICNYPKEKINKDPLSLKEFLENKIYGEYTPLSSKEIEQIFLAHPHAFLITDKTNNFDLIQSSFSFQNRIIVEIFGKEKYREALKKGIANPMLSTGNPKRNLSFIQEYNVRFIACDIESMEKQKETLRYLYKKGVTIFIYSSSDQNIFSKALGEYASAFYTDFWNISQGVANPQKESQR